MPAAMEKEEEKPVRRGRAVSRDNHSWRQSFFLAEIDFACMRHIRDQIGMNSMSEAARYALREQGTAGDSSASLRLGSKIRPGVVGMLVKAISDDDDREDLRCWTCFVNADYKSHVEAIAGRWRLRHQAEALRLAVRVQAALMGYTPEGGW